MFAPFHGDTGALHTNENYLVFRWAGAGEILFSVTRKGHAAYCHFCSDRTGLRQVRAAFSAFSEFVFYLFDWCQMIITTVKDKPSICRALGKCEFHKFAQTGGAHAFLRYR